MSGLVGVAGVEEEEEAGRGRKIGFVGEEGRPEAIPVGEVGFVFLWRTRSLAVNPSSLSSSDDESVLRTGGAGAAGAGARGEEGRG